MFLLGKHVRYNYGYRVFPCKSLSVAANCRYRMNTVGQLGQLYTYTITRKLSSDSFI
jgi:hypothetical protein